MYKKSRLYLFLKLLSILFQSSAQFVALIISFILGDYKHIISPFPPAFKTLPKLPPALFQIQVLLNF